MLSGFRVALDAKIIDLKTPVAKLHWSLSGLSQLSTIPLFNWVIARMYSDSMTQSAALVQQQAAARAFEMHSQSLAEHIATLGHVPGGSFNLTNGSTLACESMLKFRNKELKTLLCKPGSVSTIGVATQPIIPR
jgi:hypothetical protein